MDAIAPAPLSQQFPQQYAAWIAAGGAENNFRAMALAVGLVTPDPVALIWLASQTAGHLNELQLALKQAGVTPGLTSQIVVVSQPTG